MTAYYRMRARDPDCATLTYRTWTVQGAPDYAAALYTGPKCGASALADVTITSQSDDAIGSGWNLAYDVDFTALSTNAFSGDGSVTIDGHAWTVANFANSRNFGVLNGTGIRIYPNSNVSDYENPSAGSAPVLRSALSGYLPAGVQFPLCALRLWTYFAFTGIDQNFERAGSGFEATVTPTNFRMGLQVANNPSLQTASSLGLINNTSIGGFVGSYTQASGSNNVHLMTLYPTMAVWRSGLYGTGFPSEGTMSGPLMYGFSTYQQFADLNMFLHANNNNTGLGNLTYDVKRLRLEFKLV